MNTSNPKHLHHQLRFPEFNSTPPWKPTKLGDVLKEHKLKSDGKSLVHSVSVHKGLVNQIEHLGRSYAAADTSHYNLVKPNDIVYTKSPTGDFPYGIIKQSHLIEDAIVSPLYGVFTPINENIGLIIEAFFESPARANAYLAPIIKKGAKNTIQISNETFLSQTILLPTNEREQSKIASLLRTQLELISAHARKFEELKKHRRFLMQKLFTNPIKEDA